MYKKLLGGAVYARISFHVFFFFIFLKWTTYRENVQIQQMNDSHTKKKLTQTALKTEINDERSGRIWKKKKKNVQQQQQQHIYSI